MCASENPVSVFKTGNSAIIAVIKSVLDEAGINYFVKGENLQNLFGAGVIGTGYNLISGPMEVFVMQEDEEYAKELLKDIHESDR